MDAKTKQLIGSIFLLVLGIFTITLSIHTLLAGEIRLTAKGTAPGYDLSIEKTGWLFYLVPGIQFIVGVCFLIFSIFLYISRKQ